MHKNLLMRMCAETALLAKILEQGKCSDLGSRFLGAQASCLLQSGRDARAPRFLPSIELPKFTKTEQEIETILDKWIYFIKHAYHLDAVPPNVQEIPLQTAYERANTFGWSRQELDLYDYWSIKAQDARGSVTYAWKAGREEGHKEGRLEGHQERTIEIARSMLAKGIALDMVMECTGLSAAELDALKSA